MHHLWYREPNENVGNRNRKGITVFNMNWVSLCDCGIYHIDAKPLLNKLILMPPVELAKIWSAFTYILSLYIGTAKALVRLGIHPCSPELFMPIIHIHSAGL